MRTAATGIGVQLASALAATGEAADVVQAPAGVRPGAGEAPLRWLEPPKGPMGVTWGVTWGVPWPRGTCPKDATFTMTTSGGGGGGGGGEAVPVQSWPLAYWPDGSLKWTAHAAASPPGETFTLRQGAAATPAMPIQVAEAADAIDIDTGVIRCRIPRSSPHLIESIRRDGHVSLQHGRLVCLRQDRPDGIETEKGSDPILFVSRVEKVEVEQRGPVRAVVRIEGSHAAEEGRAFLPFVVRLYFYAGGDAVRMMHTFIYDGDERKDFIRGLGVRFDVPMRDELHNRHVRFAGEERGLFAEAVRGITGLRRDPGEAVRQAQVAGLPTPPLIEWAASVRDRLALIPAWGDYSLMQLSADGFAIRKRTKPGHGWISSGAGRRAAGTGYIGGASGGVAFGLRDFWQRHPTQLDICNAAGDEAQVTLWLWSPNAPAMDLRFYHDGMGMDDHAAELQGLEITYEDYEQGFGTPHGIARTSELHLWVTPTTPSRAALADFAAAVTSTPLLCCTPEHLLSTGVFGGLWSLPDRSTPAKRNIEHVLDFLVDYYRNQIDQHRWYGFWDHGDVMHTYDPDRHTWRYDVGGFAWDNSELSPDLWLWYAYLRSGRSDIFRMAEAMTRHTGEVDVYHLGRFKGLGTRHNVQHWGCSAKQLRISTAAYRRFYYYLTADERTGDLMRELVDADQTFLTLDPIRKIRKEAYAPDPRALAVGFGTDWGSLAAAWLTEWERTGNSNMRDKLVSGMKSIGTMKHGFFSGGGLFDPQTGAFTNPDHDGLSNSHLAAVFGLVEICTELVQLLDVPEFEKAWLDYCSYYNADRRERAAALGFDQRTGGLRTAYSRVTAYAAWRKKDAALAQRAWDEFFSDAKYAPLRFAATTQRIAGPDSLNPIDEAAWVSTNDTAQWSLAAMQCLALVGDALPADDPRTRP